MKKELVYLITAMLIGLAGASVLAIKLTTEQDEITKERSQLSKAPIGGFHKFAADVEWMRFINYLGSINTVDASNSEEIKKWLERLISYDPNCESFYQDGVLSISRADTKAAVAMLEKACSNDYLKNNWQIPFYAGFYLYHPAYDPKDPSKVLMAPDYNGAAKYFKMAIERSMPQPENHVVNSYIRAKAKAKGGEESYAILSVLYDEWKLEHTAAAKDPAVDATAAMPAGKCIIPNITQRLLKAAQNAKFPTDDNGKRIEPDQKALALIDKVQKDVFSDNRLCTKCLTPSSPGEKFCSSCGTTLEVWGTCKKCGTTLKKGAGFCGVCGEKTK